MFIVVISVVVAVVVAHCSQTFSLWLWRASSDVLENVFTPHFTSRYSWRWLRRSKHRKFLFILMISMEIWDQNSLTKVWRKFCSLFAQLSNDKMFVIVVVSDNKLRLDCVCVCVYISLRFCIFILPKNFIFWCWLCGWAWEKINKKQKFSLINLIFLRQFWLWQTSNVGANYFKSDVRFSVWTFGVRFLMKSLKT